MECWLFGTAEDEDTAAAVLRRLLADGEIARLTAVVAWARFRGLVRLRNELNEFAASAVVFASSLGSMRAGPLVPGLVAALRLFDEAYVFHDPTGRTFHPKIYLAEGATKAVLLVGSSNAPPGGLFSNYEASLEATFELPTDEDAPALGKAKEYLERLLDNDELCRALDEALIEHLVQDPRYAVSVMNEGHAWREAVATAWGRTRGR